MTPAQMKRLQRLIDASTKAHNAAQKAANDLCEFAKKHYGCEPGDVDADGIIDSCMGGCGYSEGMTAEAFDDEMKERTQ